MDRFLSCDWGTSSFRLRLVEKPAMRVVCSISGNEGISVVYQRWLKESANEPDRFAFFRLFLTAQLTNLASRSGEELQGVPLVISGMASSSIGLMELPYRELPFRVDGSDIVAETIGSSGSFPHQLTIISGARTSNDVLRGEETLVVGCDVLSKSQEIIYVLPGTHSKHVEVVDGEAISFKTYLTGEFFDLLSTRSILANSVEKTELYDEHASNSFGKGILDGSSSNLLNIVFRVRTNQLFKKNSPAENYHYLSGLLIGSELKDLADSKAGSIVLVTGENLKYQYEQGFRLLGLGDKLQVVDADEALVNGQFRICETIKTTKVKI